MPTCESCQRDLANAKVLDGGLLECQCGAINVGARGIDPQPDQLQPQQSSTQQQPSVERLEELIRTLREEARAERDNPFPIVMMIAMVLVSVFLGLVLGMTVGGGPSHTVTQTQVTTVVQQPMTGAVATVTMIGDSFGTLFGSPMFLVFIFPLFFFAILTLLRRNY